MEQAGTVVVEHTGGLSVGELEAVEACLAASRSPSTRRVYASQWRGFAAWCAERRLVPLPAEPSSVAGYLAALGGSGASVSTVTVAAAAIRAVHLDAGLSNPADHPGVRRTQAGLARMHGVAPRRQARALTTEQIVASVDGFADPASFRALRDRAVWLVGFAAALRRSELAGLDVEHLDRRRKGIVLTIPRSKTDQTGRGQMVAVVHGEHPHTCPVVALDDWLDAAGIDTGAVFRPIAWSDRRTLDGRLSPAAVGEVIAGRAAAAGYSGATGHSLRSSHATVAAESGGVSADLIAKTTRHSDVRSLSGYVRPTDLLRSSSSSALGL